MIDTFLLLGTKILWTAPLILLVILGLRFMVDYEDFNLGKICLKVMGEGAPVTLVTVITGAILFLTGVIYGWVYVLPLFMETIQGFYGGA